MKSWVKADPARKRISASPQRLEDELVRNRMRLAFEKEGLEVLQISPELLMLTPQAAPLAEASQSLKNARTVISLSPQEPRPRLQNFLDFSERPRGKALEAQKGT